MKTLETERLILRSWEKSDLDDFYEYAKNPNIGPNAGWKTHESKEESEKILKLFIQQDETWAIVYKDNNKVIGSVGLHYDSKRNGVNTKMLGYVLSEKYWGKGIMHEAVRKIIAYSFEELEIDILSVYHYSFNVRSRRVIEKCGFTYEGTMRLVEKIYDGRIVDESCYSILKEEYFNKLI